MHFKNVDQKKKGKEENMCFNVTLISLTNKQNLPMVTELKNSYWKGICNKKEHWGAGESLSVHGHSDILHSMI